jgi:membrane protease YdiL (CAAX protease family)
VTSVADVDRMGGRAGRHEGGLRGVFACSSPLKASMSVAGLAGIVFGYVALLLVVFDARSWWGQSLAGVAVAFAPMFGAVAVLGRGRTTDTRRLMLFALTGWAVLVAVTWVPRQRVVTTSELGYLAWWAFATIAIFVVPAVLYARHSRQSLRSYGLRLGAFAGEMRIFAVLLPLIAVGAWFASAQPRFQQVYPFFKGWPLGDGSLGEMLAWWVLYASTFVALEFFFRGFLVTAGFELIGWWAIPAMAAPYCLLHLDKPLPEMVTSLFGGLILGVVALRTRSILAGVLSHVTLAIGTDLAVLGHSRL